MSDKNKFMGKAIEMANKAISFDEIPVGCIIVSNNKIIASSHNETEINKNASRHAEIVCIEIATKHLNSKYLNECDLFVTLEPCPMCAAAIVLSKIRNVYFGAYDLQFGACGSVYNITGDGKMNHKCYTFGGIMELESKQLMKEFFQKKRNNAN